MEIMAMKHLFGGVYFKKKVLVTGHMGFKGSWLALWLAQMGAYVIGYSLQPPTEPYHFSLLDMNIKSITGDIRDLKKLRQVFDEEQPEIIFHLAAQPIVRLSYNDPVETFSSNVMGTINIFEASRAVESVNTIINITSDKCYENKEWPWGYRETDPVGGFDPYSASKGCAELITNCWRKSFFNLNEYKMTHPIFLASCRAGNVIGGGDWAVDRLIPDLVRSATQNTKVKIRNPQAVRPWQHVLDPLSGYLLLGQKLLEGHHEYAEAWNFGASDETSITVREIVSLSKKIWPQIDIETVANKQPHEATTLRLDCSKSHFKLKWRPVWDLNTSVQKTLKWYKTFYDTKKIQSHADIRQYIADAEFKQLPWTE
jgi:CDP-glucose 4,6-dehydratase